MRVLIVKKFKPFTANWGAICVPQICKDGFFVPDGWQSELTKKGIKYTEKEIDPKTYFEHESIT